MKIIDTHIHVFEKPYSDLYDNSHLKCGRAGELHLYEEYRRKYGVSAAFVICYDGGHCPRNSAYVEALAKGLKWIYSFGYVRPDPATFRDRVAEIIGRHFGISCYLCNDDHAGWLHVSELAAVWSGLQDRRIPLSLTIWPHQCVELAALLEKYPRLVILINHMGRPRLENGKLDMGSYKNVLALSEYEAVYVKLSGFYAFSGRGWGWPQRDLHPVLKLLRKNFGADRLLFASDFPPVLEFNTYRQTLEMLREKDAGFAKAELKKIYHQNAAKIISGRIKT